MENKRKENQSKKASLLLNEIINLCWVATNNPQGCSSGLWVSGHGTYNIIAGAVGRYSGLTFEEAHAFLKEELDEDEIGLYLYNSNITGIESARWDLHQICRCAEKRL